MYIIGISAFYHDSAACIIKDGQIIAAVQEERFTRIKHDSSFPTHAIQYCIHEAKISAEEINNIVFYEKPFLKFERLLETYLAFAPRGFLSFFKAMPLWIKDKLFQKSELIKKLKTTLGNNIDWNKKLLFSEHHLSHAASAFYPSPFEKAAILTLDGVGEWTTTSLSIGDGNNIHLLKEISFPHSLGLLYSAFTYYLGFKVNSGEYKVMGLAPYGQPKYVSLIKNNLIKIAKDGSFQLDMSYFDYATGLTMTTKKFDTLFGSPPRIPESDISQREMDLAASIQKVIEDIIIELAKAIAKETGERNLCLAGGVALNCVANGVLFKEKIFKNIWIQPAAGDAGGALGAALSVWYIHHQNARTVKIKRDSMKGAFLGPQYNKEEIEDELNKCGAKFLKLSEDVMLEKVVNALAEEKSIGWMQGRMEFGPRSLGGRSIIADPRSPNMQKKLNLQIKYRESFRPFAPSVLMEDVQDWFDYKTESPYMLIVADLNKNKRRVLKTNKKNLFGLDLLHLNRSYVPAITHVNYSARIQTVHEETNPIYHRMISNFKEKTGCPIVINTSFNVRGEPIVCSPTDAFKCFMGTELDILVIGNFFLIKSDQNSLLMADYKHDYELD